MKPKAPSRTRFVRRVFLSLLAGVAVISMIVFFVPLQWASNNPLFNVDVVYRYLRAGTGRISYGCTGWQYYKNALLSVVMPWPAQNADKIVAFRDSLLAEGITLVAVPIPDKHLVYPERVSRFVPGVVSRQRNNLIQQLRQRGVHVVDLLPTYALSKSEPLFYYFEDHWMDRAIVLAAQTLADSLKGIVNCPGPVTGLQLRDTVEEWCLATGAEGPPDSGCDPTFPIARTSVRSADGSPYIPDENDAQVLIFGDSNVFQGEKCNASLGPHLSRLIGCGVRSVFSLRGCSDAPRFFERNKKTLSHNTRVLVWTFISRSLALPIQGPE